MEIVANNNALITINETLIIQVISFLIFLYIINRIMFRPLRNVMAARNEHIRKIKADTSEAQNRFDSINSQIVDQETEARQAAFELKAELENQGSLEANGILSSARKEIADANETARKEVAAMVAAARADVQKESEVLAKSIIETLLERRLNS
jgi:F-type H+-transporting ATPase subunit b